MTVEFDEEEEDLEEVKQQPVLSSCQSGSELKKRESSYEGTLSKKESSSGTGRGKGAVVFVVNDKYDEFHSDSAPSYV